ncbi:MAG: hypothetical protein WAV89_08175 [Ignavibacteriaceae bacterium]
MTLDETFDLITKSFSYVFNNFSALNITKELDWERHLYVELRKNLGEQVFTKYQIRLESGAFKHGNGILWITPNTYSKKQDLVDEYFNVEKDEGGHYKILLSENIKPLTTPIKKFIDTEKDRPYYVDIIIYDNSIKQALAYIELKCGHNLTKETVLQDFYKLRRLLSVRSFSAIYIAIGYDPLNNRILWLPTNSKYNHSFNISAGIATQNYEDRPSNFLNSDELIVIIKNITQNLYENMHATEAVWSAELVYSLQPHLPKGWRINSEISAQLELGRIDLGIFDQYNNLNTAIEIKNHFEGPFPTELLNGLSKDKTLQEDFFNQTFSFISEYNFDKSILRKRSAFPKYNAGYYLNADFFEKIIEIYSQYKRMAELISSKKMVQGFMIYIDHNDDYSIRKKTHSIPEEVFLENFGFRKSVIEKILETVKNENCHFIYMYKLNSKNDVKKLFFAND